MNSSGSFVCYKICWVAQLHYWNSAVCSASQLHSLQFTGVWKWCSSEVSHQVASNLRRFLLSKASCSHSVFCKSRVAWLGNLDNLESAEVSHTRTWCGCTCWRAASAVVSVDFFPEECVLCRICTRLLRGRSSSRGQSFEWTVWSRHKRGCSAETVLMLILWSHSKYLRNYSNVSF